MAKRRAKGEGSLRKRSDGRWEGRYTVGRDPETGKLIYRNVLAWTQAECKSKLREALKNIQQETEEVLVEPTEDQKQPAAAKAISGSANQQPEQVVAYLQAAADRNVLPMFYLELTSGLRRGELLALLWDDLDIEKRTISVNKSVAGRHGELKVSAPKTQHSIRKVVIPQQAVDLLIQEHNHHPDNPYMFPSPVTGTMYYPDTAGRLHKKLSKESGIENVRFHDLRHPNVKPKTQIFFLQNRIPGL